MTEKIILASASPRRSELLHQAGIKFEVIPSQIDEDQYPSDGEDPVYYTRTLARAKALDVGKQKPNTLVLGADCVVSVDDEIIGKPKDAVDAERIIRRLFSQTHEVITSVAFITLNHGIELIETESTWVYPRQLTDKQISDYIVAGKWQGKAGGYGIQDPEGDEFIERIEGSYSNVMGLPIELVQEMLQDLFEMN